MSLPRPSRRRAHARARTALLLLTAVLPLATAACEPAGDQVREARPGLLARAAVSPDSARAVARRAVTGGIVVSAEIEEEDGRLVYSFDLRVAGLPGVEEVLVDAASGRVVSVEHESAAREAAEKREEGH